MMNFFRIFLVLALNLATVMPGALRAAEKAVVMPANQNQEQQALDALQQLLSAYVTGNTRLAESLIDPKMIGYSLVVDAMHATGQKQKQLRVAMSDTRTLVTDDVAIIQTRWEKRYLSTPALLEKRKSGMCTFVLHREASAWRLSALSGDNPFDAE